MASQIFISDILAQFVLSSCRTKSKNSLDYLQIFIYSISRVIFLLYLHPLSRFPGPRIAAISNIWYAYHWLSGRYPWAIENALRKYGPVVRIAPNELAFFTPQAFTDPIRHREVARKLSPAFSSRCVRTMEPLVHKYMDYFIVKMKELSIDTDLDGIALVRWTNWLAMDLSADLAWNKKMYQMRDRKDSIHLDLLLSFNKFATVLQVFKRFPLLSPLQYLFAPIGKIGLIAAMEKATLESIRQRINQSGSTEHEDYFDHILPAGHPVPADRRELLHIGSVALQITFAGFGPMGELFYGTLVLLLAESSCHRILVEEIRGQFEDYDAITPAALGSLPYLHACIEETLRMLPSNNTGLPRISPGATVDGHYIPKGTHVQTCIWALARSPIYFHDPLHFRPQRWLPPSHSLYDPAFSRDHLKGFYPFSLGPRICLGREMAWLQGKLFLAKVLWTFDVIKVDNQDFDLEKDLLHYGFL
ncbi:cytochrome P450 [Whalleya microplaca]|nr:cytochrome P450 [Whalleya microplaca]